MMKTKSRKTDGTSVEKSWTEQNIKYKKKI